MIKYGTLRYKAILVSLFLAAFILYGFTTILVKPSAKDQFISELLGDNPEDFGYTKGNFSVTDNGSALYEVPIMVSPGTAGMAPSLSLVYNNQSGNGLLGDGWNLNGLSMISRVPATPVQDGIIDGVDFDEKDRLMIDGQRMVLIGPETEDYGHNNTEYRTEQNSFKRIICQGGEQPESFTVNTKDGLTYYYGNNPKSNSRVLAQNRKGNILFWLVDRIEDKNGNYIDIEYESYEEGSEHRPKYIFYTGNIHTGLKPYNLVEFNYKDRKDVRFNYIGGSKVSISKLLDNITIYYSKESALRKNKIVREYRFKYKQEPISRKNHLEEIQECAGQGRKRQCLDPIRLSWLQENVASLSPVQETSYANKYAEDAKIGYGDLNADGFPDKIITHCDGNSIKVDYWLNQAHTVEPKSKNPDPKPHFSKKQSYTNTFLVTNDRKAKITYQDADADGDVDIVITWTKGNKCGYSILTTIKNGSSIDFKENSESKDFLSFKEPKFVSSDFNGDGYIDFMVNENIDNSLNFSFILQNKGGAFTQVETFEITNSSIPPRITPYTIDLNNDGLTDLLYTWTNKNGWYTETILNLVKSQGSSELNSNTFKSSKYFSNSFSEDKQVNIIELKKGKNITYERKDQQKGKKPKTTQLDTLKKDLDTLKKDLDTLKKDLDTLKVRGDSYLTNVKTTISEKDFSTEGSINLTDSNSDGIIDLLISKTNKKGWEVQIAYGDGLGGFKSPVSQSLMTDSLVSKYKFATGEFNGDNFVDLIIYYSGKNGLSSYVSYGNASGKFNKATNIIKWDKYKFCNNREVRLKSLFNNYFRKYYKDKHSWNTFKSLSNAIDYETYATWSSEKIFRELIEKQYKSLSQIAVPLGYYDPVNNRQTFLFLEGKEGEIEGRKGQAISDFFTNNSKRSENLGFASSFEKFGTYDKSYEQCEEEKPNTQKKTEKDIIVCKLLAFFIELGHHPSFDNYYLQQESSSFAYQNDKIRYSMYGYTHGSLNIPTKFIDKAYFNFENYWNLNPIDLNADGISDLVFSYPIHPPNDSGGKANDLEGNHKDFTWINKAIKSGYIDKIEEGFDVIDSTSYNQVVVDYQPLKTDVYQEDPGFTLKYPYIKVRSPLYLVKKTTSSNGIGGKSKMLYTYHNAIGSMNGRGFWGFRDVKQYHVDSKIGTYKTYYAKESGIPTSKGTKTSSYELLDKGLRFLKTSRRDYYYTESKSTPLERVDNKAYIQYGQHNDNYFLAYIEEAEEVNYKFETRDTLSYRKSDFLYDSYGNLETSSVTHKDSFVDKTINTYSNYEDDWILGRLDTSKVIKIFKNESDTAVAVFEYDEHTGQMKSEKKLSKNEFAQITKSYEFDDYGNVIKSSVKGYVDERTEQSRDIITEYDKKGRFVLSTTDAEGYKSESTYDQMYGYISTQTDVNDNTSKIEYDIFGNKVKTVDALGNYSQTYIRKCTSCDPIFAKATHFQLTMNNVGTPSLVYYDNLSREVGTESLNIYGKRVIQTKEYNSKGEIVSSSVPYFYSKPSNLEITYEYDLLGRITKTNYPNGASERVEYDGLKTKYFNAKDHETLEEKDTRGRLLSRIQVDRDGQDYELRYGYDIRNNLTTITDYFKGAATSNKVVQRYDENGNKTYVLSPNHANASISKYNAFSEVIEEISPGGDYTWFKYDRNGRLIERKDGEVNKVNWVFIAPNSNKNGKGQVDSIIVDKKMSYKPFVFNEYFEYDQYGRKSKHTYKEHIDDPTFIPYSYEYKYGKTGLLDEMIYPQIHGGLDIKYNYTYGVLTSLSDSENKTDTLYKINAIDQLNQVTEYEYGNGIKTNYYFGENDNNLNRLSIKNQREKFVDYTYGYDNLENIRSKKDLQTGIIETFDINQRDMLTKSKVKSNGKTNTVTIDYDHQGNIFKKSDVGTYKYKPNSSILESVANYKIEYDENGNRKNGSVQNPYDVSYNYFNKPTEISTAEGKIEYEYGYDFSKQFESLTINSTRSRTSKYTIGGLTEYYREEDKTDSSDKVRFIITAGGQTIGYIERKKSVTEDVESAKTITYIHNDIHQSLLFMSSKSGSNIDGKIRNYDAWGKEREADTWLPNSSNRSMAIAEAREPEPINRFLGFSLGYQNHKQVVLADIVNMGGRIYDSTLGQFMSIDPVISTVATIGLNSYAYVMNNPLKYSDPSGYFLKKLFRGIGKAFKAIGKAIGSVMRSISNFLDKNIMTIAVIGIGIATGGAALAAYTAMVSGATTALGIAIASAAGFGFGSAFSGAMFSGASFGEALQAGITSAVISGASAAITVGIGTTITPELGSSLSNGQRVAKAISHGVVQGTFQKLQGGKFEHGFLSGMFTEAFSSQVAKVGDPNKFSFKRVSAAAMIGGTASSIGGGKFANGAISGAMVQAFNHDGDKLANKKKVDCSRGCIGENKNPYSKEFVSGEGARQYINTKANSAFADAMAPTVQWLEDSFGSAINLTTKGVSFLGQSFKNANAFQAAGLAVGTTLSTVGNALLITPSAPAGLGLSMGGGAIISISRPGFWGD